MVFSVVFLYMIIGWRCVVSHDIAQIGTNSAYFSVFVGFGFMAILTGLPGLIGKMMHSTQVAKMKAVSQAIVSHRLLSSPFTERCPGPNSDRE